MALANGTRLGRYEIVAPLGGGGMGEVYCARDTRLDRTVAIKILPPHFADDATRRQRFEREAKVVSSLNHPNICTLHDIGHQDGVDFIVMEYLEGESLAERLEKGPLPAPQVLQYGTQIANSRVVGKPSLIGKVRFARDPPRMICTHTIWWVTLGDYSRVP
jgi:serine/threonine protein kinase